MLVDYMTNSVDCQTPKMNWSFAPTDSVDITKHCLSIQIGYSNNLSVFRMNNQRLSCVPSITEVEIVCSYTYNTFNAIVGGSCLKTFEI